MDKCIIFFLKNISFLFIKIRSKKLLRKRRIWFQLRILHTVRVYPGDTGSEVYFFQLSNEMMKKGHKITIMTSDLMKWQLRNIFDYYSNLNIIENNIRIKRIPYTILRFIFSLISYRTNKKTILNFFDLIFFSIEYGFIKLIRFIFKVIRKSLLWGLFQDNLGWKILYALRNENYDLIHTTCVPRSVIIASLIAAKKNKIPIMITPFYHYKEKRFYMYDNLWMSILNKFDCINVSTDAERNYLINHGIDKKKIVKIGVGIYYNLKNHENSVDWRNKLNISKEKFVALFMSPQVYNPEKGVLQVIAAALKLPHIEFIFTGKDKNSWNYMLSRHFPNEKLDNCHYVGFVSEDDKNLLLNTVDLIVRPSINESFGIIYFEGMRNGKPIITSDIDSMKEISSGVGIAVEHGNVEDLIRAIERIQSDKEFYRKLSKNALEKSKAFSWEKISERFNQIYYSLANLNNTKTDFE